MSGRILLVDEVPTSRIVLATKLRAHYFTVACAGSAAEAREAAAALRPDLVLMNTRLPDASGVDACAALKAAPETADIPVVLLADLPDPDLLSAALACGAEDLVVKPVSELSLFARLRQLMRTRNMVDELRLRDVAGAALGLDPAAGFAPLPLAELTVAGLGAEQARLEAACRAAGCRLAAPGERVDLFVVGPRPAGGVEPLARIARLRSKPTSRNAAIVAQLGGTDSAWARRALELGANDYVRAEADPLLLALRIRTQLRRKALDDALRRSLRSGLKMAVEDPLTGLFNRRYATAHLARQIDEARAADRPLSVLMIDLDRFKEINDGFGHAAGDAVLRRIAGELHANLRAIDMVARIGGEEFLVVLPGTSAEGAAGVAERLRTRIEQTPLCAGNDTPLRVTMSAGVAELGPGDDPEALIARADAALYAAKAAGRNQVSRAVAAA